MSILNSHIELINQTYNRAQQGGYRSYPAVSYEIFLLDRAQHRAKSREAALFQQLAGIFDWKLTVRERNAYIRKLRIGHTLVLTDLSKTILWTSHSFLAMTGYNQAETLGKKPGLLQGTDADSAVVLRIREALSLGKPVAADLLNYRKNGEPYTCRIQIEPLFNSRQELTHFLAVEQEVA